jgi:hypothetical protein
MKNLGSDKDCAPFIRGMSILVNTLGVIFYFTLTLGTIELSSGFSKLFIVITLWGLAPLIVTTYFLYYLRKSDHNVIGIFIVTPIAIFIHYYTMGVAAHAEFFGKNTGYFLIVLELFSAVLFIVFMRRKGYKR